MRIHPSIVIASIALLLAYALLGTARAQTLTADRQRIQVGETAHVTLTITGPAATDMELAVTIGRDSLGLASCPPSVTVPAGGQEATFELVGREPGRVTVEAAGAALDLMVTAPPLRGDMDGDGRLTMNDLVILALMVGGVDAPAF